jgi:hypothetical protein
MDWEGVKTFLKTPKGPQNQQKFVYHLVLYGFILSQKLSNNGSYDNFKANFTA